MGTKTPQAKKKKRKRYAEKEEKVAADTNLKPFQFHTWHSNIVNE
jgi:hypothetical protein